MLPVWAGIQIELDRALLEAAKAETALTPQDKIYKHRCEMIKKHLKPDDTAMSRAMWYSCKGLGIGIALYVGTDLGNYPPEQISSVYKERFEKEGLNAEVFIQKELEHGSNVVFFINGGPYLRERIGPIKGLKKITGVIANAKLIYIDTGQVDKYILTEEQIKEIAKRKEAAAQKQL